MRVEWIAAIVASWALIASSEAGAAGAEHVSAEIFTSTGFSLEGKPLLGSPLQQWLGRPAEEVVFLNGAWNELLTELEPLGILGVITGNGAVAQLAAGHYGPYEGSEEHGLVLEKGIDLRIFPKKWASGAAVLPGATEPAGFVFFDAAGKQVHRILLTPESDGEIFSALVKKYGAEKPVPAAAPGANQPEATTALSPEAKATLLEKWGALEDTHDFSAMLEELKVSRTAALRAAEGKFTAQVEKDAYRALFQKLVDQKVPVMVFVPNAGIVQIGTGVLTEASAGSGVLQLVEEDSRTAIASALVAEAWHVSKPTKNGPAHSLELYDAQGEPVAYIFGSRKDGDEGIAKWKENMNLLAAIDDSEQNTEEQAKKTAGEETADTAATPKPAAAGTVDLSKLSERTRSHLKMVVARLQEFDKNDDKVLSEAELPARMKKVLTTVNANGDAVLDESEMLAAAYRQLQAQRTERAKAATESK